ncbi:MAG TPA: DUF6481 family protein [Stellaceae bacterium]|nr:DUF6481 family protein [Stellaceae bacterium]
MQPVHTRRSELKRSKQSGFDDRLTAAANAKKTLLEKFLAKTAANDPGLAERQSVRQAIVADREIRDAKRRALRLESEAHAAAEAAAKAAVLAAEQIAREAAAAEQVVSDAADALALKVEQKIARDARYAARKARDRK